VWAAITQTLSHPYRYFVQGVDQSTYVFDDEGQLIEIRDPDGNAITLTYAAGEEEGDRERLTRQQFQIWPRMQLVRETAAVGAWKPGL
jgi:hypothetical protein